ncbi:MAG: peptidoglycan editing factor PgeF [Planctomycetota bacterium]|nr:peptidoglycan editing factor PgeF [Planctomycetota bacterium]
MLDRRTSPTGVVYYGSRLLDAAGVPHAFSTRLSGVSPAPFDSLNLGNPSGCDVLDDGERIERNYALLQNAIGCVEFPRCRMHQVHAAAVHNVRAGEPFESGVKGDALTSDDPRRVIAIRVADCVPVLVATGEGKVVAAIHAGWRGVVANVVGATVKELEVRSQSSSASFVAAIGPCIGFDAFEVGPEVVTEFEKVFGGEAPVRHADDGKGRVDLRESVKLQLAAAGLRAENIDVTDRCTYRDAAEFYSHRRDRGITGRMAALIAARP